MLGSVIYCSVCDVAYLPCPCFFCQPIPNVHHGRFRLTMAEILLPQHSFPPTPEPIDGNDNYYSGAWS
jgi:hypothetical protein